MTRLALPGPVSDTGVLAVLRAQTATQYLPICEALTEAGVVALELTLTTPGTIDLFPLLSQALPQAVFGVGTVASAEQAAAALEAGAHFLVTPIVVPEALELASRAGVSVLAGALTPGEVLQAWNLGASAVKIFPAAAVGPGYLTQLARPFPDIRAVPSGGVTLEDIPRWILGGAVAVSLGGPLLGDAFAGGDLNALQQPSGGGTERCEPSPAAGRMKHVVTLGEALGLVRADGLGTFAQIGTAAVGTGGAEANVAIALARLGIQATWLGRVGEDSIGRRIVRELRAENVDARAVLDAERPTAFMLKESPAPGRTSVTFLRTESAGSRLNVIDVKLLPIEEADLLHVSGSLPGLSASCEQALREAVERANRAAVPVSFDVNHRNRLWSPDQAAEIYRWIAQRADTVFGGVEELEILVGEHPDHLELARAVAQLGPDEVIVKLAQAGAGAMVNGTWADREAEAIVPVDTVGAGDAFVAAYLAARLQGRTVGEALAQGNRNGAAACLHPGDWEKEPSTDPPWRRTTRRGTPWLAETTPSAPARVTHVPGAGSLRALSKAAVAQPDTRCRAA